MKFITTAACLALLMNLFACRKSDKSESDKGTLTVTFDGKTKVYNDARVSEGKLGEIVSLNFNAGSEASDNLSITVFGTQAGSYPYKQKIDDYKQVSQIEYKTKETVFNNYFVQICPDKTGYYSTPGEVKIEEYVAGQHIKGTFSGALLDAHSENECEPVNNTFSGTFDIPVR